MPVLICKMCGGELEIVKSSVCECRYCGTKQTVPHFSGDTYQNIVNRATFYRQQGEFDKALQLYEKILAEYGSDVDILWSSVLCKYGIEYVDDLKNHKKIPTCHRMQTLSILDDGDYLELLAEANEEQKLIITAEAKYIATLQKNILSISAKERPYDIFICYKQTDKNGEDTEDSALAFDIYNMLSKEGYRVFFAKVSLEGKLGEAYEPYIFAALNSAKVMVVVGCNAENFESTWVKNEWSRYINLIKQGKDKFLIPVYKNMSPYELPSAFAHLQAQDMSKIACMQDLLYGIKKVLGRTSNQFIQRHTVDTQNINNLIERIYILLEDGDWAKANTYCEKVLNINARCAEAYLGQLMVDLRVKRIDDLLTCEKPFDDNKNYEKIVRYGEETLVKKINSYIVEIRSRNIYREASGLMKTAKKQHEFSKAGELFKSIIGYGNADELSKNCFRKALELQKKNMYYYVRNKMQEHKIKSYFEAINVLKQLQALDTAGEFDTKVQIVRCEKAIKRIKRRQAVCRTMAIALPISFVVIIISAIILDKVILPFTSYHIANIKVKNSNYVDAYETYYSLGNYKESQEKAEAIKGEYQKQVLQEVEVGDVIYIGTYEQDGNLENGKEVMEWVVLLVEKDCVCVANVYYIDAKPFCSFSNEDDTLTWEDSSMRKWLNHEFLDSAFSNFEIGLIKDTTHFTTYTSKERGVKDVYTHMYTDKIYIRSLDESVWNDYQGFNFKGTTPYLKDRGYKWKIRTCVSDTYDWNMVRTSESSFGDPARNYVIRPIMWLKK